MTRPLLGDDERVSNPAAMGKEKKQADDDDHHHGLDGDG